MFTFAQFVACCYCCRIRCQLVSIDSSSFHAQRACFGQTEPQFPVHWRQLPYTIEYIHRLDTAAVYPTLHPFDPKISFCRFWYGLHLHRHYPHPVLTKIQLNLCLHYAIASHATNAHLHDFSSSTIAALRPGKSPDMELSAINFPIYFLAQHLIPLIRSQNKLLTASVNINLWKIGLLKRRRKKP